MIVNRELKFRVWDKLEKCFIYPDKGYQGHYILTLGGEFYNLQNGSGGNEYIVQQYTGAKDKNGIEIYEGDILKIHWRIESINLDHYFEAVKWDSFQHCWGPIGTLTIDSIENDVVGNIFENPEIKLL